VPGDQPTIQAGIDAAQNGDTVLVDEGTYIENINFSGKAITVASNFIMDGDTIHIDNTIIDGSQPSHPDSGSVVYFTSGEDTNSILCGFTITGGTGTYDPFPVRVGGGILCSSSGAKIIHNHIEYNSCELNSVEVDGGGMSVGPPGNTSWVILENNVISNNLILCAVDGGGGGIQVTGNVKLLNNIIEYNTAESIEGLIWGGGIFLNYGNIITNYEWFVIDNTIRHNKAISPAGTGINGGAGGGLAVKGQSKATIKNNIITYNEVQSNDPISDCHGGGVLLQNQNESTIFSENYVAFNKALENSFCKGAGISIWSADFTSKPRLYNNIIVNNTNGNIGGGIFISGHGTYTNEPVLINNTISQNSAVLGGAVYSDQSHPLIINSILWNNGSEIYQSGAEVMVYYSDVEGGWTGTGSNNIDSDPFFMDPSIFDFHLQDISPCIGAGVDSIEIAGICHYAPFYDFEGDPRPNPDSSNPDIGADEHPLPVPVPVELTSFTATSQTGKVTLNWTTATEINNLGFEIERKIINETDGEWVRIGFSEGHCTTTETKSYQYIDNISDLQAGSLRYRLKQIDFDGSYEYSNEVMVDNPAPIDFALHQNYPNPFNPTTRITFGIPLKSQVSLKIFNSIGEQVAQLVKEEKEAGRYSVELNATNLPSGVYFYRLKTDSFVETKKMILLK
jgi:hypothetical protein